jgi:hypothetical protein
MRRVEGGNALKEEDSMKCLVGTIIALTWLASVPFAEAIDITLAEVQNGVAVVQGNKAAKQATISWEAGNVGLTTKGGSFSFSGIVPADCVGQLSIGVDTINVALANCVSPLLATGQTTPFLANKDDGIVGPVAVDDDGTLKLGTPLRYRGLGVTEKFDLQKFAEKLYPVVKDWHTALSKNASTAQQALRKLVPGRLVAQRNENGTWTFTASRIDFTPLIREVGVTGDAISALLQEVKVTRTRARRGARRGPRTG